MTFSSKNLHFFSAFIGRFFQQLQRQWTIASAICFNIGYNNNSKKSGETQLFNPLLD